MNSLILLVKKMLCSKLHFQKGFNLILFSYKIGDIQRALDILLRQTHPHLFGVKPPREASTFYFECRPSSWSSRECQESEAAGGDQLHTRESLVGRLSHIRIPKKGPLAGRCQAKSDNLRCFKEFNLKGKAKVWP